MKKLSFFHSFMAALMMTAAFTACSSDDDDNSTPEPTQSSHYDLTITVGKHGGMSKTETHVTLSVAALDNPSCIRYQL